MLNTIANIRNMIKSKGHISIATFMEETITSYYEHKTSIGTSGDFITSPEVSQLFGEMIGLWVYLQWKNMSFPKQFVLVEFGPGRGTLMKDLLRATKHIEELHSAMQVHFIERSNKLKLHQQDLAKKYSNISFEWHDNFLSVPKLPTIVIANEFFDAIPISQYVKLRNEWYENIVTMLPNDGDLCLSSMAVSGKMASLLNREYPNATHRDIVELSPHSIEIIKHITRHINKYNGTCLIIDYGYDYKPEYRTYFASTLQAVRNHKYHPVLLDIGDADITAHVDFNSLSRAAQVSGCYVEEVIEQRDFLFNMGIEIRLNFLLERATEMQKDFLINGFDRLTSKEQMGSLFKVLMFMNEKICNRIGFE